MARQPDYKTVDLHGLTSAEAKKRLERELSRAPREIKRIIVIHGCNNGTVLRDMVRGMRHSRIMEIVPTFSNDGETVIYLKK